MRKLRATVSFGAFGLNYAMVRPIREKALRTVDACLSSDSSRAALRATESVSRVLSGFLPAVGRPISDEEFRWQTGERIAVLEVVENRLKKPAPTALVRQIRSVLRSSRPHDDIWLVSFMHYDLGYFDLETRVLEPLENPFGPKVLPMFYKKGSQEKKRPCGWNFLASQPT